MLSTTHTNTRCLRFVVDVDAAAAAAADEVPSHVRW